MLSVRRPRPPLDRFVDCLWHSGAYTPAHDRERVLPTGAVELVFQLRGERIQIFDDELDTTGGCFQGAVVTGAQSRYFVLDASQQSAVVGVHFRPGGAAPFLAMPLSDITDRHVGLEDIWGREALAVRERLQEAERTSTLFAVLEDVLLARLREPPASYLAIVDAISQISADPSIARVQRISDSTGYSPKRFIRLFHDTVGLTPKLFCRVQRFQMLLDTIIGGRRIEWARAALDCGYFDQSHMIRDFRAFSGTTPLGYRPADADRKNHVVIM